MRGWLTIAGVVSVGASAPGAAAPADFNDLAERLRGRDWSARVELRSRVGDERSGPPRRMSVAWAAATRTATLSAGGLRVVAEPGRLVAWNPLHAGVVFEMIEEGAGVGGLIAEALPPLLLPPLAVAVGGGGPVVGAGGPRAWSVESGAFAGDGGGASCVVVPSTGAPWATRWTVTAGSVVHGLSIAPGGEPIALPADLDERRRVASMAELAGRAGDVRPGDRLPLVRLGVVGGEGGWSPGAVFSTDGREPAALVLFLVPVSSDGGPTAIEVVRAMRRALVRRAVIAGRPAERFLGVVARAVFVAPPAAYDPEALASAAVGWVMPGQAGFDEAEAGSPAALWAPPEELLVRVAPDASAAVIAVSSSGRLEAVRPFDAATVETLAVELADAIAPDLVPD